MTPERLHQLRAIYRDGLLNDTLPFWLPRALDREHGGYFTCFDRDGSLLQTDKPIWFQGRFAWLLAMLFDTVERRPEWLEAARHGIDFLRRHGFDRDGRMFFSVTRQGEPLRKRRYLFSEAFAAIALAAYGRAADDEPSRREALELFRLILRNHRTPGLLPEKVISSTRTQKGLAMPMILLVTAQELRKSVADPLPGEVIEQSVDEIERHFWKPELGCMLETVGPVGEFHDTLDGRLMCPGHSIEAAWFILEEARLRNGDPRLVRLGCDILDASLRIGWDGDHGGIFYYRDAKGRSPTEYWHDMKFWWPHNEAIIATLLAWLLTNDARYGRWHEMVHDWAYAHFPDPLHGEWYGYLHRDGTVSTPVKGTMWKGPFHLPRMQWYCWQRLEERLTEKP